MQSVSNRVSSKKPPRKRRYSGPSRHAKKDHRRLIFRTRVVPIRVGQVFAKASASCRISEPHQPLVPGFPNSAEQAFIAGPNRGRVKFVGATGAAAFRFRHGDLDFLNRKKPAAPPWIGGRAGLGWGGHENRKDRLFRSSNLLILSSYVGTICPDDQSSSSGSSGKPRAGDVNFLRRKRASMVAMPSA